MNMEIIELLFTIAMRAGPIDLIIDLKRAFDSYTNDPTPENLEAIKAAHQAISDTLDADIAEKETEV